MDVIKPEKPKAPNFNKKIIECCFCHNIKKDIDEKAHRFGSFEEKLNWFSTINTTGYCPSKFPCYDQYHNPCQNTNLYNLGHKLMYCTPFCWLSARGHIEGLTKKNLQFLLQWCDDHLSGSDCEQVKRRINGSFPQWMTKLVLHDLE